MQKGGGVLAFHIHPFVSPTTIATRSRQQNQINQLDIRLDVTLALAATYNLCRFFFFVYDITTGIKTIPGWIVSCAWFHHRSPFIFFIPKLHH